MTGPPAFLPPAWADNPRRIDLDARLVLPAGDPVPLAVAAGAVTHDWSDAWRSTATLSLPWDPAVWDVVREWQTPRVEIDAVCVLPSGAREAVRLFGGYVRDAGTRRPDDRIDLAAASAASLVADLPFTAAYASPAGPSAVTVIRALVDGVLPGLTWDARADGAAVAVGADVGDARMPVVEQLADAAGLDVYPDPYGVWRVERQAADPVLPAVDVLQVGANGNVIDSGSDYARDAFANGYAVRAEWTDAGGVARSAVGTAYDSDPASLTRWGGPAGMRMRVARESGPLDAASCTLVAAARLRRALGAGRGARVAVPLRPWLFPRDTVAVVLPFGGPRNQVVHRVAHDLAAMTTTVDTRQTLY